MRLCPTPAGFSDSTNHTFSPDCHPGIRGSELAPSTTFIDSSNHDELRHKGVPVIPAIALAAQLGIQSVQTDSEGVIRFTQDPKNANELGHMRDISLSTMQVLTDVVLDSQLKTVEAYSSRHGTGTLISAAATNRLGQNGIIALVNAGYIVRTPEVDIENGIGNHTSIFPNPTPEFLKQLGKHAGVKIEDLRCHCSSLPQPPTRDLEQVFISDAQAA